MKHYSGSVLSAVFTFAACSGGTKDSVARLSEQVTASQQAIAELRLANEQQVARLRTQDSASDVRERQNRALHSILDSLQTSLGEYLEARRADSISAAGMSRGSGYQALNNTGASASNPGRLSTQQFRTVRATLTALEAMRNGGVRVTIRFENTDTQYGIAIAHRAENSDGIADFWKFFPTPLGLVTDSRGNQYSLSKQSPLGFARDASDFLVLKHGEAATQTFIFEGSTTSAGATFSISMDLKIFTGLNERTQSGRWSLVFADIRP